MSSPTITSPQVAVNDIGSAEDFLAAIDSTIKYFNDGDIVEGTIVKVDRDEVLLDIGYKTEGVIPSRELSIKHDVDPSEVVNVGDEVEALVLTKEDKEGRLILSKKRAQYERAWGTIEKVKESDGVVTGKVIEVGGVSVAPVNVRSGQPLRQRFLNDYGSTRIAADARARLSILGLASGHARELDELWNACKSAPAGQRTTPCSKVVDGNYPNYRQVIPGESKERIPLERDGKHYVLIDTAGIRRKARVGEGVEKFSVIKALQAENPAALLHERLGL